MAKRGRGRPTLLDDEMMAKMIGLIRAGNYRETAAAACGIAVNTFRNWEKRGVTAERNADRAGIKVPKRERRYVDFLHALQKAEAEAEAFGIALITREAQAGSWQAMAWRLERTRPQKFGKRVHVEAEVSANAVTLYPTTVGHVTTTLVIPEGEG